MIGQVLLFLHLLCITLSLGQTCTCTGCTSSVTLEPEETSAMEQGGCSSGNALASLNFATTDGSSTFTMCTLDQTQYDYYENSQAYTCIPAGSTTNPSICFKASNVGGTSSYIYALVTCSNTAATCPFDYYFTYTCTTVNPPVTTPTYTPPTYTATSELIGFIYSSSICVSPVALVSFSSGECTYSSNLQQYYSMVDYGSYGYASFCGSTYCSSCSTDYVYYGDCDSLVSGYYGTFYKVSPQYWTILQFVDSACSEQTNSISLTADGDCTSAFGNYIRFASVENGFVYAIFEDSECTYLTYGYEIQTSCYLVGGYYYTFVMSSSSIMQVSYLGFLFVLLSIILQISCK